jgi:hypothetical protein
MPQADSMAPIAKINTPSNKSFVGVDYFNALRAVKQAVSAER